MKNPTYSADRLGKNNDINADFKAWAEKTTIPVKKLGKAHTIFLEGLKDYLHNLENYEFNDEEGNLSKAQKEELKKEIIEATKEEQFYLTEELRNILSNLYKSNLEEDVVRQIIYLRTQQVENFLNTYCHFLMTQWNYLNNIQNPRFIFEIYKALHEALYTKPPTPNSDTVNQVTDKTNKNIWNQLADSQDMNPEAPSTLSVDSLSPHEEPKPVYFSVPWFSVD